MWIKFGCSCCRHDSYASLASARSPFFPDQLIALSRFPKKDLFFEWEAFIVNSWKRSRLHWCVSLELTRLTLYDDLFLTLGNMESRCLSIFLLIIIPHVKKKTLSELSLISN